MPIVTVIVANIVEEEAEAESFEPTFAGICAGILTCNANQTISLSIVTRASMVGTN